MSKAAYLYVPAVGDLVTWKGIMRGPGLHIPFAMGVVRKIDEFSVTIEMPYYFLEAGLLRSGFEDRTYSRVLFRRLSPRLKRKATCA